MIIHFTSYAEKKFDILAKHKNYLTKEHVEEVLRLPDKLDKQENLYAATRKDICVLYRQDGEISRIVTFFPIKN